MKNLLSAFILLLTITTVSLKSHAQDEARLKIEMTVKYQGKDIKTQLNNVSTSLSRYYEDAAASLPSKKSSDSTTTKATTSASSLYPGAFFLTLDIKSLPDDMLKIFSKKKATFDGTIIITDSYGKIPVRTLKFFKASLYSYSDQYSSYYNEAAGNASISLSCNSISINGITLEQ